MTDVASAMSVRERLPNRRYAETTDIEVGGIRYTATAGRYADGRPAEIFLNGAKPGSTIDTAAADSAILVARLAARDLDRRPATCVAARCAGRADRPLGVNSRRACREGRRMTDVAATGIVESAPKRRGNQHSLGWPPERVEEVRRRWDAGESMAVIAAAVGLSRSSIAGARTRLGLKPRTTLVALPNPMSGNRAAKVRWEKAKTSWQKTTAGAGKRPSLPKPKDDPGDFPIGQRISSVLDLPFTGACKWIVGRLGQGGFFCGATTDPGKTLCQAHQARAYLRREP